MKPFTFSYSGLFDTTYTVSVIAQNYCGSDTSTTDISVYPDEVTAFFTTDVTSGCMPLSVNFQNFSVGSNLIYSWDFGDGNFSNSRTVNHIFTTSGTFNVQLIVNDGCSFDTLFQVINVFPVPQGNFSSLDDSVCGTDTIQFLNSNTGSSFNWDFGDGNFSTLTEPFNIYASPGVYNVKLISTSLANGCSVEDSIEVFSLTNPETLFSIDTNLGCLPLSVNFTNNSLNSDYFYWDFGDGSNTSNLNPSYTYNLHGSFTGSLVSTNLNGCQDSVSFLVQVNPKPNAGFSYNNIDSCVLPISFFFQNTSTINSSYTWSFGDGDTSTLSNPTNSYANNGQFLVDLYIENIFGCRDTAQNVLNIDTIPLADFEMDTISGCIPLLVSFNNNSQNSSFFSWDFGDGNFSSSASPSYTYSIPGNYQIQLLSQDANGCFDSSFSSIHIFPEPNANFTFSNTNSCFQPVLVDLLNTSLGSNYYYWDFGNGISSSNTSPNFNYDSIGVYNISLIAGNSYSCEDTIIQSFNVYQQPQAIFNPNQDSICLRDSIFLSSINSQYQDLITWNLNGSLFNTMNDTAIFIANPGFYYLEMYASNNNGICIDTSAHNSGIEVLPSPIADFLISPTDGCKPLIGVDFINQSVSADFYLWDFSNGNTASSINSNENFYNDGIYNISLHVSNTLGCVDSIFKTLEVFPKPVADFSFTNSEPCYQPTQLIFNNLSLGSSIYNWDFGNSQFSSNQNPTINYVNPGNFNIELIVENTFGCKDTIEDNFQALQVPIAEFILSDDTICVGDSVIFISQSQYSDFVNWDLSNGYSFTGNNFIYEFLDTTTVDVTLQAFSNNGCSDTIQVASSVVVINSPVAEFIIADTSYNRTEPLAGTFSFSNLSQNATNYYWEFPYGDNSYSFNPVLDFNYYDEGYYTYLLNAFNGCGVDVYSLIINMKFEKSLYIPNALYIGHSDIEISRFKAVGTGMEEFSMMIFDNYGNVIWESSELTDLGEPLKYWDGTVRGENALQDVYLWKVFGKYKDESMWEGNPTLNKNKLFKKEFYYTGSVTLIR
jgi:PKD repeat protein